MLNNKFFIAVLCIICILLIYRQKQATESFDSHISGIWVMDENSAAESEITSMMLYISPPTAGIFRSSVTGYAVVNSGGEVLDDSFNFTYMRTSPFLGDVTISANMDQNTVFGRQVNMQFNTALGYLKIYDDKTNYGLFWRQNGIIN